MGRATIGRHKTGASDMRKSLWYLLVISFALIAPTSHLAAGDKRLVLSSSYNSEGEIESYTAYQYDENGNRTRVSAFDSRCQ